MEKTLRITWRVVNQPSYWREPIPPPRARDRHVIGRRLAAKSGVQTSKRTFSEGHFRKDEPFQSHFGKWGLLILVGRARGDRGAHGCWTGTISFGSESRQLLPSSVTITWLDALYLFPRVNCTQRVPTFVRFRPPGRSTGTTFSNHSFYKNVTYFNAVISGILKLINKVMHYDVIERWLETRWACIELEHLGFHLWHNGLSIYLSDEIYFLRKVSHGYSCVEIWRASLLTFPLEFSLPELTCWFRTHYSCSSNSTIDWFFVESIFCIDCTTNTIQHNQMMTSIICNSPITSGMIGGNFFLPKIEESIVL